MNQGFNDDLRRRQQTGDHTWARGSELARGPRGRRLLVVPVLLVVLGIVLVYVGPVPGLGVLLVVGGVIGAFVVLAQAWLGG